MPDFSEKHAPHGYKSNSFGLTRHDVIPGYGDLWRVYETRACEQFTFFCCGDCGWSCREDEHLICKENEHLILLMEEILPVSKRCRCKYMKHIIPALPPSPLDMQCCLVDEECLCTQEILQVNIALRGGGGRTKCDYVFAILYTTYSMLC